MQLLELTLTTNSLALQRDFYGRRLGLPVFIDTGRLIVEVGKSRLIFKLAATFSGVYHFAINIPENQFALAKVWLKERVLLLRDTAGHDEFYSEDWNSHQLYFYDATGNIVELIARHTLPNASSQTFNPSSLLELSEIGVASENLTQDLASYRQTFGLTPYGATSANFASLGDEHGLLIVVQRGRVWFPNTGKPAEFLPLHIKMQTTLGERHLVLTKPPA